MQYTKPKSRRFTQPWLVLLALVAVAFVMAVVSSFENGEFAWRGLAGNLSTELIGAIITYGIIDRMIKASADNRELKKRLIRRLENPDTGVTWETLAELRDHGWLQDGSFYGWFLQRANLEGAYLRDWQTNGLGLYRSNLTGAKIEVEQLVVMNDLRRTVMPDGQLYDGRYCLVGDLTWARTQYSLDVNVATPQQMADYYEVSLERYLEGQRWAKENLPKYNIDLPKYLKRSEG